MALRDFLDINITTRGSDQVFISIAPDIWADDNAAQTDQQREAEAQGQRQYNQKLLLTVADRLSDMDLTLAGGQDASRALLEYEPVEIVRKLA